MTRPFPLSGRLAPTVAIGVILSGLMAASAFAQTAPRGTGLDDGMDPGMGRGGPPPPGMDGGQPPGPPGGPRPDPFAGLPRPLTPDMVRKALDEQFSKRPHVGQVTERDDKTLVVEIVNPDGRSMKMLVDKETGARQPLR
ncbi:MAG TPA: hypothetical protein VM661_14945 [Candidatus Sulfotelmatobacter sp.]|jgi:hypothetical protein|nr:hypothetical protein [Candidatus Sulfotelmatobacter sp.]